MYETQMTLAGQVLWTKSLTLYDQDLVGADGMSDQQVTDMNQYVRTMPQTISDPVSFEELTLQDTWLVAYWMPDEVSGLIEIAVRSKYVNANGKVFLERSKWICNMPKYLHKR
jgi:hypothetical protein